MIKKRTTNGADIPGFLMERFANWLNGYTKAFNKMHHRSGSLFVDYLRRVAITSDRQIAATLFYIHKNPVHHGCCKTIEEWHWSSFRAYKHRRYGILSPLFVQAFFGTVAAFEKFHAQPVSLKEAGLLE